MMVWQGQAVFTPEEVSTILNLDVSSVYGLIRRGELGACRVRDSIGVPPPLLDEYQRQTQAWSSSAA